jgi:hypothetical protein
MEARMRALMFALAMTATACVDMSPDESSGSQNAEVQNKLAANKLAANKLAANSLSSTRLVALDDTSDILQGSFGREVYRYMVSCALDEGTTIEKADVVNYCHVESGEEICGDTPEPFPAGEEDWCTVSSSDPTRASCVYPGGVGLAPEWTTHKLKPQAQGWVSACLFARSNLFDIGVGISMRGRHPALEVGVSEQQDYTLQEGAFYGNVFTGIDKKTGEPNEIEWFACQGLDEYRVATGELPDAGGLALRDCTEQDGTTGKTKCGFTFTGNCADFDGAGDPYACRTSDAAGNFSECSDEPRAGHFGGTDKYRQVITVYLTP